MSYPNDGIAFPFWRAYGDMLGWRASQRGKSVYYKHAARRYQSWVYGAAP